MAVVFTRIDLDFILQQIQIAEALTRGVPVAQLIPNPEFGFGLRSVTGEGNNLRAGRTQYGAADNAFPRLLPIDLITADVTPPGFGPPNPTPTSYTQTSGLVFDSDPRTISNLIVDDTAHNPAAVAAAAGTPGSEVVTGTRTDGSTFETFFIPNTTPDGGLSAPFNAWMTFFGQFFDHGLDLVTKGGNGTIFIPLQPDDPLYVVGSPTNFMVLTRATMQPGADGVLGTADDIHEQENTTSPFVDQNQTYSSHPSHQVFLRAYEIGADGAPHATGKLITNRELGADGKYGTADDSEIGGMATWAVVKAQAREILGIHLTDAQVFDVPLLATDEYGNFIKGAHGFPQVVIRTGNGADGVAGTADDVTTLVEGNPAANGGLGIDITNAVSTGHQFLVDIAHDSDPTGGKLADTDSLLNGDLNGNGVIDPTETAVVAGRYDNEMLDKHYIAGDGRVNENIGLTAVHSIFHSEHNRLIDQTKTEILAENDLVFLNKWLMPDAQITALPTTQAALDALHWNGERLFQAAKFGTEMQYQHLVFEEFARTIQPTIDAFVDFNDTIDPSIMAEFAHTVYRFGHSMLTETVDRLDPNFASSEIGLIQAFLNPLEFAASGDTPTEAVGAIVRGLTRQVGNEIDEFVTEALRNNLVGLPLDLPAINIARGRDVGIPSLNAARATFYAGTGDSNLKPYISWADFVQHIRHPESLINFIAAYGTHDSIVNATTLADKRAAALLIVLGGDDAPADRLDFLNSTGAWANNALGHDKDRDGVTTTGLGSIDFWMGGLAEAQMPFGGMLGTTFGFVFETQLESLQNGDRFYYLHRVDGLPFQFQLENNLFSKLVMANSDATHLPAHVFTTPGYTLEVDPTKQFTGEGASGRDDPTGGDMINLAGADGVFGTPDDISVEVTKLVIRDNPNTVGVDTNYLQYTGGDHVVLGGTAGNDVLVASEGDDTLWGDGGNDRLEGGYGNDEIDGGAGDDILTDMGGTNVIHGGDGNDVIAVGNADAGGSNLILAGAGNDFIIGREDVIEVFAGAGNDFIRGNFIDLQLMGGEGDDWIEQGTQDGAPGDTFGPIFPQPQDATHAAGNDVFLGDSGFDENLGEGGDDIVVASEGPDREKLGSGYDWVTFKTDPFGVVADMSRIVKEQLPNFTDSVRGIHILYQLTEGLSGSHFSDFLTGSDDDVTRLTTVVLEENADHALRNFALVSGLRAFVGAAGNGADGIANTADDVFAGGNIILGGGGSDVIEGRTGDDLIDGDKWLNVRISVRAGTDGSGTQINTFDSMDSVDASGKRLSEYMLDGTYNPGQLVVVREILTDAVVPAQLGHSFDTAQFSGLLSEYQIITSGGVTTVTDTVVGRDGVDRLTNIERLQFNDTSVLLPGNAGANAGPAGQVAILNAANTPLAGPPASGEVLHASVAGVTDANNTGGALHASEVTYIWQSEQVPGSGIFQDILVIVEGGAAVQRAMGASFTVTTAEVGLQIRAKAIYQDDHGVVEQVTSAPTVAVVAGAPIAPPTPLPQETLVSSPGVHFIRSDLQFILDQIKLSEKIAAGTDPASLLPDMRAPLGLRTVLGDDNNLREGQSKFGAAERTFPRLLDPQFIDADPVPDGFGPPGQTSYNQTSGLVFDSDPRTISNLISDDTANNPAAVAAAAGTPGSGVEHGTRADGTPFDTLFIPNTAPDGGLSAPFNAWMTFFGQFFDHGLDLVTKGGPNGTVFIPLQPDDPLYVVGSPTNFMVMTRATMLPGADGVLGTADDIHEQENTTSPFVDQNQTYSSHPSHQVFLRAYEIGADGAPHATGELITNRDLGPDGKYGTADDVKLGGMATWAIVKAQARDILGINLTDAQVFDVPLLATDAYGNFLKGPHGFPMVVLKGVDGVGGTTDDVLIEGNPAANGGLGISLTNAVGTGHQFLIDVAHDSDPSGGKLADTDTLLNGDLNGNGVIDPIETAVVAGQYDNEMLDKHYIAGDGRVNENIGLTAVHSIFHSEHNRLVQLTKDVAIASNDVSFINEWLMPDAQITSLPTTQAAIDALHWNGERLFQSAKFGTEMQYQHLVFEEFARTIQPNIDFFVPENQNYHIDIDASIVAEFAHTVYRFGHSMLTETIDRLDPDYNSSEIGLIQAFLNPLEFAASGDTSEEAVGSIVRGLTRQVGNEIDEFVTEALRNNLVGLPLDLAALNLARGRDVGIPSLNAARAKFYAASGDSNLKAYISWADFVQHMKHPESLINFIAAYGTHDSITAATTLAEKREAAALIVLGGDGAPADRLDFLNSTGAWANNAGVPKDRDGVTTTGLGSIDLWIGGLAEELMPFGGMLGSTFNFVFENQLEKLQNGDRLYYLSRTAGLNFSSELENNSFAALIMANSDATHLPDLVFKTPTWILEVDQSKQFTGEGANLRADPTGNPGDLTPLVIRDNPNTVGPDSNYLQYTGEDHVVLGGTDNIDFLLSGDGDDTIYGDAGNDRIDGGYGNDFVHGGQGDDIITDLGGDDVIHGDEGNDVIQSGNGINLIHAGPGKDFIVTGTDSSEVFGGTGDDFIRGTLNDESLMGGEGDDWIEEGTGDAAPGDNFDPFNRDPIAGNDIFIGNGSTDIFFAEGGDDMMFGNGGAGDRYIGDSGYDWAGFKDDAFGVSVNIGLPDDAFTPPLPERAATVARFRSVEGLSGSHQSDILVGDTFDATAIRGSGANGSVLTNISLINGLQPLLDMAFHSTLVTGGTLADGVTATGTTVTSFGAGNIILGGGGSDIITGNGGDDVIDGDKWLNVRISVRQNIDGSGPEIATFANMTDLIPFMVAGTYNPGQLVAVREILTDAFDPLHPGRSFDTVTFAGVMSEYVITVDNNGTASNFADDVYTVTDTVAGRDGSDRIMHVERLQFSDQARVLVPAGQNAEPTGNIVLRNASTGAVVTAPVQGDTLRVSLASLVDADNVSSGGAVVQPVAYVWQVETRPGSGVFEDIGVDIGGAVGIASGETFTVTAAELGLAIRVKGIYQDQHGTLETVFSAGTAAVVIDTPATGAPTISDTTPTEDIAILASTAGITDVNGLAAATFAFQWQRAATAAGPFTDIVGATTASFTPRAAQVLQVLRVVVTVTDDLGGVTVLTSTPTGQVGDHVLGNAAANTLSATAFDDWIDGFGAADILNGGDGDDLLVGGAAADTLNGGNGNDALFGDAGADTLNGGVGADTMTGGIGSDRFIVDNAGDVVIELLNEGSDIVLTTLASYALTANVEDLTFNGTGNFSGGGNNLANIIRAGAGNDTLSGNDGNDTLFGGDGSDTLNGGAGVDDLRGEEGNDTLNGGDGNDRLQGALGTDILNGDAGNDALDGNAGNDVITGGAGNDTINGGVDTDTAVYAGTLINYVIGGNTTTLTVTDSTGADGIDTLTGIEILRIAGTDYAVTRGNDNANGAINGGNGSQVLFGFGGADTLNGGAGNDLLIGGAGNDSINGGDGDDFIFQNSTGDGQDFIDGGAGTGDTYVLTGDASTETFRIYAKASWLAIAGNTAAQLNANTEIVITRNGTNAASILAQLDNVEEIKINSLLTTAQNNDGVVNGTLPGAPGDVVQVIGNFEAPFTSLAFNTITIAGSSANDTIDISGLTSAHRVVFDANGGTDTFIGAIRPQDVITGISANNLHGSAGGGIENDFQLMELVNDANVAGNAPSHQFGMQQSRHELNGMGLSNHADLFLNTHDLFNTVGNKWLNAHQVEADYALLQG